MYLSLNRYWLNYKPYVRLTNILHGRRWIDDLIKRVGLGTYKSLYLWTNKIQGSPYIRVDRGSKGYTPFYRTGI